MTNPCFHCADRHPVCHDTCTIHKNDFDEEFWHGNPQRRRRRHR